MAKGEIVKLGEIVKANNGLFRCKYKIKDVLAGRIFMAFASLVDHKDVKENQSFVEYKISASSILSKTCTGGDNYKQLQDAAKILIDQKIEQHKHARHFKYYSLFSTIEYDNGIIKGEFHKDLMPFFLMAKEQFTKIRLSEYMQLQSIYSQLIFSFLKSWDDKKEITIKISELHDMLDTPKSMKNNYAEFKRRVLDKAYKDINEKTSLGFEFEAIKNGRSFSEIKFKFVKKRKIPTSATPQGIALVQEVLRLESPSPKYREFNEFLRRFPDRGPCRWDAWKIWSELQEKGVAPLAKDVQDKNVVSVINFLNEWKNRGKING